MDQAHLEPEILILDEVLAVGDVAFQKKCFGKIKDVSKGGRTVLFVSHNMGSLQQLCTKGLVLHKGQTVIQGEISTAISHYLSKIESKTTKLIERTDRLGSGAVTVTNIEIHDSNGLKLNEVCAGSSVRICFHYQKHTSQPLRNLFIGFRINTSLGQPIIYHHNRLNSDTINIIEKEGSFICDIESLPLVPGVYKLTYSILSSVYDEQYIDSLSNAIDIVVIGSNFYGSGMLPTASHGIFLINARWK